MKLTPIPAFEDNYIWILHDSTHAIVVDPGDATPVLDFLQSHQLEPVAVFITHHHWDHVDGLPNLRASYRNLPVYAPQDERITQATHTAHVDKPLHIMGLDWQVLNLSGHTTSHIGYYCASFANVNGNADTNAGTGTTTDISKTTAPLLFSGDCIFKAGCGRLFEGTAEHMHNSLQRIAALPNNTRIACTHEYTLANMAFATHVEPDNQALLNEQQRCMDLREQGLPTLPSTVALEKATNPFVRATTAQAFGKLRKQKDVF